MFYLSSGHRAPTCPLSGRCRRCHKPGHVARECTQAWGPSPSTVSTDFPVNNDDSSVSDSATVIEDDCVPECDLVSITEPSADLPADPVNVPDKLPVVDPAKVSDKPPDKSPADNDESMTTSTKPRVSKSSRSSVSAKVFCARLSKFFNPLRFPDFDATGREWHSKAKAHLRLQIKTVLNGRDIAVNYSDLRTWPENDLRDVSNPFCELSVRRDYLVDFVFGVVKSYWNNAKKAV